jgi:hypothetical protein
MGKQSRRKRDAQRARPRRGESPESRAFREHLQLEDAVEDAAGALLSALRKAGIEIQILDLGALAEIARPIAVVEVHGERLPVVEPRDPGRWSSARDFDRQMFEAGLTRFIRAPLPGDVIAPDAAPGVVLVCHKPGSPSPCSRSSSHA